MKKINCLVMLVLLCTAFELSAKDETNPGLIWDDASFGMGVGMDYGGIGGNLIILPQENIGIFGGVGYAIAGVGYNIGLKCRLNNVNYSPFIMAMYGYNAAISVSNTPLGMNLDKLFYGPTVGLGLDYRSSVKNRTYWSFAILIPIRDTEVQNYIDYLKKTWGVEFKNDLLPIGFSVGIKFIIN